MTVILAAAVLPVPPLTEETFPVVLFCTPSTAPVTVMLNWQLPPPAIVAPERAIVLVAAVTTRLFVPPQTLEVESETDKPIGKTSVTETPVS